MRTSSSVNCPACSVCACVPMRSKENMAVAAVLKWTAAIGETDIVMIQGGMKSGRPARGMADCPAGGA
jgi:hypothetical protein